MASLLELLQETRSELNTTLKDMEQAKKMDGTKQQVVQRTNGTEENARQGSPTCKGGEESDCGSSSESEYSSGDSDSASDTDSDYSSSSDDESTSFSISSGGLSSSGSSDSESDGEESGLNSSEEKPLSANKADNTLNKESNAASRPGSNNYGHNKLTSGSKHNDVLIKNSTNSQINAESDSLQQSHSEALSQNEHCLPIEANEEKSDNVTSIATAKSDVNTRSTLKNDADVLNSAVATHVPKSTQSSEAIESKHTNPSLLSGHEESMPENNTAPDIIAITHKDIVSGEPRSGQKDILHDNGPSPFDENGNTDTLKQPHNDYVSEKDESFDTKSKESDVKSRETKNKLYSLGKDAKSQHKDNIEGKSAQKKEESSRDACRGSSTSNDKCDEEPVPAARRRTQSPNERQKGEKDDKDNLQSNAKNDPEDKEPSPATKEIEQRDCVKQQKDESNKNEGKKHQTNSYKGNIADGPIEHVNDEKIVHDKSEAPDIVALPHTDNLADADGNNSKDILKESATSGLSNNSDVDIMGLHHKDKVSTRDGGGGVHNERKQKNSEGTDLKTSVKESPHDEQPKRDEWAPDKVRDTAIEKSESDETRAENKGKTEKASVSNSEKAVIKESDDNDIVALPHQDNLDLQDSGAFSSNNDGADMVSGANNGPSVLSRNNSEDVLQKEHIDNVTSKDEQCFPKNGSVDISKSEERPMLNESPLGNKDGKAKESPSKTKLVSRSGKQNDKKPASPRKRSKSPQKIGKTVERNPDDSIQKDKPSAKEKDKQSKKESEKATISEPNKIIKKHPEDTPVKQMKDKKETNPDRKYDDVHDKPHKETSNEQTNSPKKQQSPRKTQPQMNNEPSTLKSNLQDKENMSPREKKTSKDKGDSKAPRKEDKNAPINDKHTSPRKKKDTEDKEESKSPRKKVKNTPTDDDSKSPRRSDNKDKDDSKSSRKNDKDVHNDSTEPKHDISKDTKAQKSNEPLPKKESVSPKKKNDNKGKGASNSPGKEEKDYFANLDEEAVIKAFMRKSDKNPPQSQPSEDTSEPIDKVAEANDPAPIINTKKANPGRKVNDSEQHKNSSQSPSAKKIGDPDEEDVLQINTIPNNSENNESPVPDDKSGKVLTQSNKKKNIDLDAVSWSTWPANDQDTNGKDNDKVKSDDSHAKGTLNDSTVPQNDDPAKNDGTSRDLNKHSERPIIPNKTCNTKDKRNNNNDQARSKNGQSDSYEDKKGKKPVVKSPKPKRKVRKKQNRDPGKKKGRSSSLPPESARSANSQNDNGSTKSEGAKESKDSSTRLPKITSTAVVANNKLRVNVRAPEKLMLPLLDSTQKKDKSINIDMNIVVTKPEKKYAPPQHRWKPPPKSKKDLPVWLAPPDVNYPRRKHPLAPRRYVGHSDPDILVNRAAWPQFKVKWPDKDYKHYSDEEGEV